MLYICILYITIICYRLYIDTRPMLLVYAMVVTRYGICIYTKYIIHVPLAIYIYTKSMLLVYAMVVTMYGICIYTKYI